jgi:hypothetical protein
MEEGYEMKLGFRVGNFLHEIGSPDLLHAFFSTISYHLEPKGWGTRYPELMQDLYQGKLSASGVKKAYKDLLRIKRKLLSYPSSRIVWDIENLNAEPPGDLLRVGAKDLTAGFVTTTGRSLFDLLLECLRTASERKEEVSVEQFFEKKTPDGSSSFLLEN